MNKKLTRIIELANQIQDAILEYDDVLSVHIDGNEKNRITTGVHLYDIKKHGVEGLEPYCRDNCGLWLNSRAYGVNVFGNVCGGDEA